MIGVTREERDNSKWRLAGDTMVVMGSALSPQFLQFEYFLRDICFGLIHNRPKSKSTQFKWYRH